MKTNCVKQVTSSFIIDDNCCLLGYCIPLWEIKNVSGILVLMLILVEILDSFHNVYKMRLSTICSHSSEGGNCRQVKNSIISDDHKFYEKNKAKWWDRNYYCRHREEGMKIQTQWPENQENWLCSTNPKVGRLETEEKMML